MERLLDEKKSTVKNPSQGIQLSQTWITITGWSFLSIFHMWYPQPKLASVQTQHPRVAFV